MLVGYDGVNKINGDAYAVQKNECVCERWNSKIDLMNKGYEQEHDKKHVQ